MPDETKPAEGRAPDTKVEQHRPTQHQTVSKGGTTPSDRVQPLKTEPPYVQPERQLDQRARELREARYGGRFAAPTVSTAGAKYPMLTALRVVVPAYGAKVNGETVIGVADENCNVYGVNFYPNDDIVGDNTDKFLVALNYYRGTANGVIVASLEFVTGTHADKLQPIAVALAPPPGPTWEGSEQPRGGKAQVMQPRAPAPPAPQNLLEGDVLTWSSAYAGTNGLANPGGLLEILLQRS